MSQKLNISLLGELSVSSEDGVAPLPASRKARALLAFLASTGRPHRRERLCELLWDLPDDPKASLRWALTKLRKVVDSPSRARIIADRERVHLDTEDIFIDIQNIHARLRDTNDVISVDDLESMARQLGNVFLDGLDGAGDEIFESWLRTEREDVRAANIRVLKLLATHPDLTPVATRKWQRLLSEADPDHGWPENRSAPSAPSPEPSPPAPERRPETKEERAKRVAEARARALRSQRIGFCQAKDGTKIAYATLGSGPPLLKAANWLNHLEFDWDSPIWGKSFATLARYRTFIRYDERGCGLSDWDVADLSFEAFVEDLEAVADKLELERFPLLGISQGAAVSIEYAVRHPERVSALVLCGSYAAGWRHLASPEEKARREAVLTLTELGWGTDNPAYRHIFSQTFMPDATAQDLAWFDEFQRQTTSPRNAARFQDAFGYIDVRHRLAEVKAPTIVLHAKHDQRIPLEQGRAVASGIPNALFVPLDSRNHIITDEEPAWQTAVEAVAQFAIENSI